MSMLPRCHPRRVAGGGGGSGLSTCPCRPCHLPCPPCHRQVDRHSPSWGPPQPSPLRQTGDAGSVQQCRPYHLSIKSHVSAVEDSRGSGGFEEDTWVRYLCANQCQGTQGDEWRQCGPAEGVGRWKVCPKIALLIAPVRWNVHRGPPENIGNIGPV